MKFTTSIVAATSLTTVALADNTILFTSFGLPGCSVNQLEQVTISDTSCEVISSGGFSFFTTTDIATDPGCNVVFSNSGSCDTFDAVIEPNNQQCFEASGGIGDIIHAFVFCN